MRRRVDGSAPPSELLTFHGRRYATAREWEAAFSVWCEARQRWLDERGLDVLLPMEVDGDCPWDPTAI